MDSINDRSVRQLLRKQLLTLSGLNVAWENRPFTPPDPDAGTIWLRDQLDPISEAHAANLIIEGRRTYRVTLSIRSGAGTEDVDDVAKQVKDAFKPATRLTGFGFVVDIDRAERRQGVVASAWFEMPVEVHMRVYSSATTSFTWWHGHAPGAEMLALRASAQSTNSPVRELEFLNSVLITDGWNGTSWDLNPSFVDNVVHGIAERNDFGGGHSYLDAADPDFLLPPTVRFLMFDQEGFLSEGDFSTNLATMRTWMSLAHSTIAAAGYPDAKFGWFRVPNHRLSDIGEHTGFIEALNDPNVPAEEQPDFLAGILAAVGGSIGDPDGDFDGAQALTESVLQIWASASPDIRGGRPFVVYRDPALSQGGVFIRNLTDSEIVQQTELIETYVPYAQHAVRDGTDWPVIAHMCQVIRDWQLANR